MADYVSTEEEAETRAAYTWKQATMDLAYSTRLTLMESSWIVEEFRRTDVHPYDAFPIMVRVFTAGFDHNDVRGLARAVAELVNLR